MFSPRKSEPIPQLFSDTISLASRCKPPTRQLLGEQLVGRLPHRPAALQLRMNEWMKECFLAHFLSLLTRVCCCCYHTFFVGVVARFSCLFMLLLSWNLSHSRQNFLQTKLQTFASVAFCCAPEATKANIMLRFGEIYKSNKTNKTNKSNRTNTRNSSTVARLLFCSCCFCGLDEIEALRCGQSNF